MASEGAFRAGEPTSGPGRDLPPVTPPSGRFIAQLFLVPGLIVFFVVLLVLGINYMFVGGQSPEQFLVRIDSNNPDIRWRGANDLAQVLKRQDGVHLRTDVGFALDLCERLDKAIKELEKDEKTLGESVGKDKDATADKVFRKLEAQRNLVNFLAASLGDFNFPAGMPLLGEIVVKDPGPDLVNGTLRQRRAVVGLGKPRRQRQEIQNPETRLPESDPRQTSPRRERGERCPPKSCEERALLSQRISRCEG